MEIHTVAVGDPEGGGENRVDTRTLRDIAARTGGQSFFASDTEALRDTYAQIDRLTPAPGRATELSPAHAACASCAGAGGGDRRGGAGAADRAQGTEDAGMSDPFGDLALALGAFHLLRPLWLLMLVPILALWWVNRRAATRAAEPMDGIAPHLRAALSVGGGARRRILPIDGVALVLGLAVVGASGPSWTRQADPFAAQAGPLVVVLKVTPSMASTDLAPTRLDRAKFKIRDLLALRAGARTALVAYAGTAHRVVPFTEDAGLMQPYLEGLTPEIMPEPGTDAARALALAREMLAEEEAPGGILLVLDTLDPGGAAALLRNEEEGSAMALEMLPADAPRTEWPGRATVVRTTADDSDIRRLDRSFEVDFHRAMLSNEDLPWEDRGWWLAVPAAILTLIWFRRGWTMHWAVVLGALIFTPPGAARADGIADWFWTPDQQGARAYARNDFFDRGGSVRRSDVEGARALSRGSL
ncbi:VWA domain-containing protein [Jhaorihella thermophila]